MARNTFLRWLKHVKRLPVRWRQASNKQMLRRYRPQLERLESREVPATISPAQLREAYGIDQIKFGSAGIVGNGAGQTIALVVIGIDASLVSDLKFFDQQLFGSGPDGAQLLDTFGNYTGPVANSTAPWFDAVNDTNPNFPPSPANSRQALEAAIDVEGAHLVAPMANILVVQTGSIQSGTNYAGLLQAQQPSLGISVIASSSSHFPTFHPEDYANTNVAYVGITGDTGAPIYSQLDSFTGDDFPPASPLVIAVGGTTLTLNADGSYGSETGWGFAGPNRFLTSDQAYIAPGYWNAVSGGFSGTYYTSPGPSGSTSTVWSTTITSSDTLGINDSGLEVSATWTPSPSNADNAEYVVNVSDSNGTLIETTPPILINQQLAPEGNTATLNSRTAVFQELCALSGLQVGDRISITLYAQNGDGNVVADAIGIGPDDASGGGLANADQPQPTFQNGLVIHNGNSIISSGGVRAYPDVAFDGDYVNSPVEFYSQGSVHLGAGTSLGAPAWAGLLAIADQGLAMFGYAPLNTAQALAGLYSLPASDFHDETSGYNGYLAGPGYDLITGLGSPIANQLILALDNTVATANKPITGPLTYEAPEGQGTNNINVGVSGTNIDIWNNGTVVASAPVAAITAIDIIGASNTTNTLTLNFGPISNFHPFPAPPTGIPITFDGGSLGGGAGTLVLEGGNFMTEVDSATGPHTGTITLDNTSIAYQNLTPIIDTTTATTLTINDPMNGDHITVQDDPNSPETGTPTSEIIGSGFEKIDFGNKTNVVFVDTSGSGADTFNVINPLVNNASFTSVAGQAPTITNGPANSTATLGESYTFQYTASGIPAPSFTLLPGSTLPTGLTLSSDGLLSGTDTNAADVGQTFTGTVDASNGVGTDATQAYSIIINQILASPTITVTPGGTVVLDTGNNLTAAATLAGGDQETGTITFTLYAPNNTIVDVETVDVSGDGIYTTPHGYLPSSSGIYQWVANYSGDSNNFSVSTNKGDSPEVVVGRGATVVGNSLYLVGGNTNDQLNIAPIGTSETGSTGIQVTGQLNKVNIHNLFYTQPFIAIYVTGFGGNDNFQFTDTLTITTVVSDGNGNDNIHPGNGNNTVSVGNGNDNIQLGNGNNVIVAGKGNDNILAGDGTDVITAGAWGTTGNIHVQLGNGVNDQVALLGNGNDMVRIGNGNGVSVSVDGNGNDQIQIGNGNHDSVSLVGNGNEFVQTGTGTGTLHIAGTGKKNLHLGLGWTQI